MPALSPALQLLCELAGRGITVEVDGDRLRYHPRSVILPADRDRLRNLKAEIIAHLTTPEPAPAWIDALDRSFDRQPAEAGPEWCPRYCHPVAWRSIFGPHLICGTCHPPAFPWLVAGWTTDVAVSKRLDESEP